MRHIFGFILCLIGISLCFSCGGRRSAHPYLMKVDSLMQERPDSALALLQVMSDVSSLTDADKAYYAVLLTAATDKNYLPLISCDSLLDFALRYYDGEKEEARALFYKGRLLAEMNDLKAAIDLNLKALDILENYPEETDIKMLVNGGGIAIPIAHSNDKGRKIHFLQTKQQKVVIRKARMSFS